MRATLYDEFGREIQVDILEADRKSRTCKVQVVAPQVVYWGTEKVPTREVSFDELTNFVVICEGCGEEIAPASTCWNCGRDDREGREPGEDDTLETLRDEYYGRG